MSLLLPTSSSAYSPSLSLFRTRVFFSSISLARLRVSPIDTIDHAARRYRTQLWRVSRDSRDDRRYFDAWHTRVRATQSKIERVRCTFKVANFAKHISEESSRRVGRGKPYRSRKLLLGHRPRQGFRRRFSRRNERGRSFNSEISRRVSIVYSSWETLLPAPSARIRSAVHA